MPTANITLPKETHSRVGLSTTAPTRDLRGVLTQHFQILRCSSTSVLPAHSERLLIKQFPALLRTEEGLTNLMRHRLEPCLAVLVQIDLRLICLPIIINLHRILVNRNDSSRTSPQPLLLIQKLRNERHHDIVSDCMSERARAKIGVLVILGHEAPEGVVVERRDMEIANELVFTEVYR
jgi:hypothetical protein